MCTTCGCSDGATVSVTHLESGKQTVLPRPQFGEGLHGHEHHSHGHEHHSHGHEHGPSVISLEQSLLARNDALAQRNRGWFEGRQVLTLNLVSSPGSGKTTLLERTLVDLRSEFGLAVIEGDQATLHDAERIRKTGCDVIQVNTGTGCHLEADMVMNGVRQLKIAPESVLFIENVGNLVCPALFDLGEAAKVAILSVTEGEDKPLKYPHMFRASRVMLLNKTDLLPHLDFDVERCVDYARQVNPELEVLQVSARTGEGMDSWYTWIRREYQQLLDLQG
ncbi:MAG: hydrogenase nickel incorporation protein HypB [bacterium]